MKFHVCCQNCVGHNYYENASSLAFDTLDQAMTYLKNLNEKNILLIPDVRGAIRWNFASCANDGILYDPDPDVDVLEMKQIINIIPGDENYIEIGSCFRDDENAVISLHRSYLLDCDGHVSQLKTCDMIAC